MANFLETIVEEKSMMRREVRKYFQLNAIKEYECLETGYLERTNEDITKWVENILRFDFKKNRRLWTPGRAVASPLYLCSKRYNSEVVPGGVSLGGLGSLAPPSCLRHNLVRHPARPALWRTFRLKAIIRLSNHLMCHPNITH
jgi:hypothetical protein